MLFTPHTIAATAAGTAAMLAATAVSASARPPEQVDTGPWVPNGPGLTVAATHPAVTPSTVIVRRNVDTGADTLTVLAVAGGTLLLGAAGGFGGARMAGRHQVAARP